jgi:hypothetical protein
MGHYDSCYAADEANKASLKITKVQRKLYFEKLKRKPVVLHEEICDRNMIMVKALMNDKTYALRLGSKQLNYREYKVYVKTKKQIEQELQAEREKHFGEGI